MSLIIADPALARSIQRLKPEARKALALTCAQRLVSATLAEPHLAAIIERGCLVPPLSDAWDRLLQSDSDRPLEEPLLNAVLSGVPSQDVRDSVRFGYTVEDAAIGLAQALRACCRDGDATETRRTAAQLYNSLDVYIIDDCGIDVFAPGGEERVRSDPRIRRELERLHRDIEDLRVDPSPATFARLRARAIEEAPYVFH